MQFRDTSAEDLRVDNMLVLQYENQQKGGVSHTPQRQWAMYDGAGWAELSGTRDRRKPLECGEGQQSLITRNAATFRFVEEGKYRMVYGMACMPQGWEPDFRRYCTVQTGVFPVR